MPTQDGDTKLLSLLGPPSFDEPLALEKPYSVLYYLAYQAQWVSRDDLAFLYRSDASRDVALSHLRKLIYRVKDIEWADSLEIERSKLRFLIPTDIQYFKDAVASQNWATALELYKGELLQGLHTPDAFAYTEWLELERQQLHLLWRSAVMGFVESSGQNQHKTKALKRLLSFDAFDEEALQAYLTLLLDGQRSGKQNRHEALRVFTTFKEAVKLEFDMEPLASTVALVQAFDSVNTLATEDAVQVSSLPSTSTQFVGRTQELTALFETLGQEDCRLLSIVGLGGVGKSRLALELAWQLQAEKADLENSNQFVFFMTLTNVTTGPALIAKLAEGINITLTGQLEPLEQLKRTIGSRPIYLVLDMFEHLLEHKGILEELLASCPKFKLLITSRERLNLANEQVFLLDGLQTPPLTEPETILTSEAVMLFIQAARQTKLDLQFNHKDATHLATIAQAVQGSPLGLELAASWLRIMPLSDIAKRLDTDLELLASSNLEPLFEQSWQYLKPNEQHLLFELTAFASSMSLDCIQTLTKANLGQLTSLLDKSFLQLNPRGFYDVHPLIHAFVKQKALEEASSEKILLLAQERHGVFFLNMLAQTGSELHQEGQVKALETLEHHFADIRAAWYWGLSEDRSENLFEACEQLYWFFTLQGRFAEAITMIQDALAIFDKPSAALQTFGLLGRLLMAEASCLGRMNSDEDAVLVGERSINILDQSNDDLGKMASRITLSAILWRQGDYAYAHRCIREAKTLHKREFEKRWMGQLLGMQALIEAGLGRSVQAMLSFQRALNINRKIGNRMQSVVALYGVGHALLDAGKLRQAERMLSQALKLAEDIKYQAFQAVIMTSLAQIKLSRKHYSQAEELAIRILQDTNLTRDQVAEADAFIVLGRVNIAQQANEKAKEQLMRGLTLGIDVQNQVTSIRALLGFAEYYLVSEESQDAKDLLEGLIHTAPAFEKTQIEQKLSKLEQTPSQDPDLSLDELVEQVMSEHVDLVVEQLYSNDSSSF